MFHFLKHELIPLESKERTKQNINNFINSCQSFFQHSLSIFALNIILNNSASVKRISQYSFFSQHYKIIVNFKLTRTSGSLKDSN